jgi:hypothetical protein
VFVSVTRATTPDQSTADAAIIGEQIDGWLRQIEGFHGLLILSHGGTTVGLALWESREVAEHNSSVRAQFLERVSTVANLEVEEVLGLEVAYAQLPHSLMSS